MGKFLSPLRDEQVRGRIYRLTDNLVYQSTAGVLYTVPAGLEWDGASVPRVLWWLYPPRGGDYDAAACLHDALYADAPFFKVDRWQADALFDEAMEACGFRASGRAVVYRAVRLGGWVAWKKHRKAEA